MNKETVIIYSDIHEYSVHSMNLFQELTLAVETNTDRLIVATGDIVDRIGVKNSEVDKAQHSLKYLRSILGDLAISGNHEGGFENMGAVRVVGGVRVYFTHGDREFWGDKKSAEFRRKDFGKSWFGRGLSDIGNSLRGFWPARFSKDDIRACVESAKNRNAQIIVTGHKHPSKILHEVADGIHIFCVPRGRTPLELGTFLFN
jgi:predicted MPP superfamily phosphohydrolase